MWKNRKQWCCFMAVLAILAGIAAKIVSASGNNDPDLIVYDMAKIVPNDQLISLGSPGDLGGEILEGNLELFGRFDHQEGPLTVGVFVAKGKGKARVTQPFFEHATITFGEVTLIDENGQRRTLRVGDSYYARQGAVIIWDQKVPVVQESIFWYTQP